MSIPVQDYALLSKHVYGDMDAMPPLSKGSEFKSPSGATYKVVEVSNKSSDLGYQGAIYQNKATGELVVAHRGTEPKLSSPEVIKDGVIADGAMVFEAVNPQAQAAMRFMDRAKELSQLPAYRWHNGSPDVNGDTPEITVTGHSLGGTLAQITAERYALGGETFNAYGAIGLSGIREGRSAHGMINHMRATDFVSAGNGHYGEVRVYANAEDIAALQSAGVSTAQQGTAGFVYDVANNVGAHAMGQSFWPPTNSVISEENRQRYRDNAALVDAFRDDVRTSREVITFGSQINQAVQGDVGAIKHLTSTPLPSVPDHVQRSVINNAIEPAEARL
ncbi:MAG: lipase family protein, partial [Arenimonas sp.]